jgi:IS605 OrfB family transposase
MITIKLPYKTEFDFTTILKQYSSIVRYSYNRFLDGKNEKEIRLMTKSLNNTDLLNSWMIQCGVREGKQLQTRFDNNRIIFGGKKNFIKKIQNKITKEEYQLKRILPLTIQGEVLQKGNRCFNLDIIENNKIIFKLNRNYHIELQLPKLRTNIKNKLIKLQLLNDEMGYTYQIKLDLSNIYISFEEFKQEIMTLNENRHLGIDLNPDTIGITILDNDKIIHAQEFSLKPIFKKIFNENLASDSDKMRYFQNKLQFETYEISKQITKLATHFNCKTVYIEDLKFKQKLSGDQKYNRIGNRKNKNLWKKELFKQNLEKRLVMNGIKLYSVNPAYSSFIGNLQHNYTDAVNASIEIARRGFEYRIKKNKTKFYPVLIVKHQWKEMATKFQNWKEFYLEIKNLKLKYRVQLEELTNLKAVFSLNQCKKSMILNYTFYD